MMEGNMEFSSNKKEMYEEVAIQMKGLFEDCPHMIANLANASALLNQAMKDINWVGFYLLEHMEAEDGYSMSASRGKSRTDSVFEQEKISESILEEEGKRLVLGPFQGKAACVEIKIGRGVCGTAVAKDEVMLIKDVHEFPGHIACDGASRSEIVLPVHVEGKIVGVLDIDSPLLARFDEEDQTGLVKVVEVIEEMLAVIDKSKRRKNENILG